MWRRDKILGAGAFYAPALSCFDAERVAPSALQVSEQRVLPILECLHTRFVMLNAVKSSQQAGATFISVCAALHRHRYSC
jgi:hypothetical protein